jgi:hypothetical protein
MSVIRAVAALLAASLLVAAPVLAEGEHQGFPPTATIWGPSDDGLAMALKVSTTTIHLNDKLPATIQILNRSGAYVYLARTVPSNDYTFVVVDRGGHIAPPSSNVPLDLSMNGVTGQGFGIDPGQAFFEGFKDLIGYVAFPGPGVYTITVATRVEFKEHPGGPYATLQSNPVTVTVLP